MYDSSRQAGAEIVSPAMVDAGLMALARICPLDVAFPVGGERDAVEAVLQAALQSTAAAAN